MYTFFPLEGGCGGDGAGFRLSSSGGGEEVGRGTSRYVFVDNLFRAWFLCLYIHFLECPFFVPFLM